MTGDPGGYEVLATGAPYQLDALETDVLAELQAGIDPRGEDVLGIPDQPDPVTTRDTGPRLEDGDQDIDQHPEV